jgi:hypothetical protein
MSSASNAINTVVSVGTIIAAVVGSVLGLIFCIAGIIVIVCLVKHCKKSRGAVANGMVLPPNSQYSNYPPNQYYNSNYPPNQNYAPTYPSLQSEYTRPAIT